jgi:cyclophilin family peptidyl-prolyl cis-trans isomerase/HEAT repeat protein
LIKVSRKTGVRGAASLLTLTIVTLAALAPRASASSRALAGAGLADDAASAAAAVARLKPVLEAESRRIFDPATVALLDDADPAVAARAALAIGRTKRPEAVEPLVAHLGAFDDAVRAMCVFGLGVVADPGPVGRLELLLDDDGSSAVRYAAADALGRIVAAHPSAGDNVLLADLVTAMRDDRDPIVRAHAASVLDAFRTLPNATSAAAGLGVAFERERDAAVRWHEMWALFRGFATKADRSLLVRGLVSREELVRIEAVRAWGRRSDDADAPALLKPLLDDPSWRVQLQARESLKLLAKEPPTDHLTAVPAGLHLPKLGPSATNDEPALARVPVPLATPRPSGAPVTAPPSAGLPSPAASAPVPSSTSAPPTPAASRTPASTIPTPVPYSGPPTVAPTAPGLAALDLSIPLLPRTAALMNGPMPGLHPRVRLRTSAGDIVLRLYPEWAPRTVANFLSLVDRGYFDGNRWFRIVPDFVDQTGDPNDDGDGDAGYSLDAEENPVEQRSGIIAMGLNYDKDHPLRDSAGTQFYLTLSPQLHLDRDFSVFGEVETGFDVMAHLIENDRILRADRLAAK